jgi:hypothetical protein
MGRHNRDRPRSHEPFEVERTLAAAEQDEAEQQQAGAAGARCSCGSRELLLQAYLRVVDGVPEPEPVEVETLTCPECSREYEAIQGEGGRILRGDFIGMLEDDAAD